MDAKQKADLTAAARLSEISLRWTMNQLFFLIHSGALTLVTTQFTDSIYLYRGTCFFGIWLGVVWLLMTLRAQYLVESWNRKMRDLELQQLDASRRVRRPTRRRREPEVPEEQAEVLIFTTADRRVPSPRGFPIHSLLKWLVVTFIVAWIALFVRSFFGP